MKNRKLVTAWDVLISFKDALKVGVKCGVIPASEFQDTAANDRDFLEKMRRCEDEL